MKVTIVCTGFSRSSIILQPWYHVYQLSRKMMERGVEISVVTDGVAGRPATEVLDGLRVKRVNHFYRQLFLRNARLCSAISDRDPDAIIWFGSPLSSVYLTRLKGVRKPVIWNIDNELYDLRLFGRVSFHDIVSSHHRFLWYPAATALCPRALIRGAANSPMTRKIVVPSQFLKSSLVGIGVSSQKIAVVPSGMTGVRVSEREHTQEVKKRIGSESDYLVAYFGSPCTLRGTDTLIRSVPYIMSEVKNIKLVVLSRRKPGDPNSEERYLGSLARKLNVQKHVQIVAGILDRDTLEAYIRSSDVIALPFKLLFNEFPLCILEAMSLGKAIVTTRIGSLVELIGTNRGLLVEPNRPDLLARSLLYLLKNPRRAAELGKNGRRFASEFPRWDEISERMIELVRDVIVQRD